MADSDDTTTLPSVTRRMLLTGTMAATVTWPFETGADAAGALAGNATADPALDLWRQWLAAYNETQRLWKRQLALERRMVAAVGFPEVEMTLPGKKQPVRAFSLEDIDRICGDASGERRMVAAVGFPRVEITLPGERQPVRAFSLEDIDRICGDASGHQAVKTRAIAAFRQRQEAWDRLDDALGYSRAEKAEIRADRTEMKLADALMATPATTLAGVAGKLDAVLRRGEYFEAGPDFPWPQLRAALADLVRIGQAWQPGLFMPGCDVKGFPAANGRAS
ncbi:hypothetical protein ATN84_07075 [Paramesorhizobium deserti]|uniref:Uncharacterized protein n=1 Tax=Paramesorhizobium deserti TaxID=1494590 RepID=A0A135HVF8_9HYPH|nr:hypothetical protein [Paramesorhizobium deserti]KXF77176.1 hypothetical protein ATN84_07075 [Paramesorhizobium deserti]